MDAINTAVDLFKGQPAGTGKSDAKIKTAIRQIVDKAVVSEGIIDVFDTADFKEGVHKMGGGGKGDILFSIRAKPI